MFVNKENKFLWFTFCLQNRWVSERVLLCTSKQKQMKKFQQQSQNMKQTNHSAEYFLAYSGNCCVYYKDWKGNL